MKPYADWIAANVIDHGAGAGYGKCEQTAIAMVAAFPELEVRKGFFRDALWGDRAHWWCRRRSDGRIIDPTALQHPSGILFPENASAYEDLTDATEEEMARRCPTGRCPSCGEPVYRGAEFCDDACFRSYVIYCTRGDR